MQRLHGVDHAHVGALLLERRADGVEIRLRQDADRLGPAQACGSERDLGRGLLPGHEQCASPGPSDRAQRAQEERGLADPRLAADEDERGGHEPSSEHAVELGNSGRDPLPFARRDVAERRRRPRSRRGRLLRGVQLLGERAESAAAGALPEPARAGGAALGAHVLDEDFRRHSSQCRNAVRRRRSRK